MRTRPWRMNRRSPAQGRLRKTTTHAGGFRATLAASFCIASVASTAAALEIKVTVMGQAGIEDPAFEVLLNDKVVGSGIVSVAAKSAEGQYLGPGTDLASFTQQFTFEVADDGVPASGVVGVKFVNDYYDEGKGVDANLYVVSVSLDGVSLDLAGIEVVAQNNEPREPILWDGAVALPWVGTASVSYAPPAVAAAVESEVAVSAPAAEPEITAPICAAPGVLVITDFPNGEAALSSTGRALLDGLIASNLAGCAVEVTGYSSPGGPPELNQTVSAARAAAVESYLRARELDAASIYSTGAGETEQFGEAATNRRVVVTVK